MKTQLSLVIEYNLHDRDLSVNFPLLFMNKIILEESMVSICARHSICLKKKQGYFHIFLPNTLRFISVM